MQLRALLLTLACFSTREFAIAQDQIDPNARYCEVAMDVRVNDRVVASPNAIVEFGKEAEVTIHDPGNNPHGWQIRFVVDEPSLVRRALVMPSRIQLFELADDRSFLRAEPHLNIVPGQPANLEMALDDGRKVSLNVTGVIRSGAEIQAHFDAAGEPSD